MKLSMNQTIELFNVMPITNQLWLESWLYPFFTLLSNACLGLTHNQDDDKRYLTLTWTKDILTALKNWEGYKTIDRRTVQGFTNYQFNTLEEHGFTCLMPRSVWVTLDAAFIETNVSVGKRKSIARVYCYLYYYAMRFQGSFSHSREQILQELAMNNHTFNDSIKWLEKHEFVVRSDYSMRPDERYSRRYYIPEDYWSSECRKEWSAMQRGLQEK